MPEEAATTELVVIGGGPGGYAAAIRAGQLGADVTLVERDAMGGVCLNAGCIPSKALVSAASLAHRAGTAEHMGIHASPTVEMDQLANWRDEVVGHMSGAVEKLCRANGVRLVEGTARFVDAENVVIDGADGAHTLEFEHAIVCTGSKPVELSGLEFSTEGILAAADVLSLDEMPDEVVVVGAGYIGLELATAFAKLGSSVEVVEALDAILPGFDAELVRPVRRRLTELGIDLQLGYAATGTETGDVGIEVIAENESGERRHLSGEVALVAVGREPLAETLDPDRIGLERTASGALKTDDYGETSVENIYAAGDVTGEPMLAHAATHTGTAIARTVASGTPTVVGDAVVPAAAFTDPEIASVGPTEAEARNEGLEPTVGTFPFQASGRAITADETTGFVRLVGDSEGTLVGGHVVGDHASELIAEIGLAIEVEASVEDIARTIHAHPTLGEAVMEAAGNAQGRAIHTLNR